MRPARLAETLPAINWRQTVGSLERQHPPWILGGKSADLIQLPKGLLRNNLVTFLGASVSALWCSSIPHESHEETC